MAVARLDGLPRVWDLESGTQVFALSGHEQLCDAMAFSPDGSQLATGDQGGTVKIWDADSGQELLSFGSGGLIHILAYSPDGARLASANEDGTLLVWDPTTGQEALSLPRMSCLYSVAISPDGSRLATAGGDGTLRIFIMDMNELVALARSRLTRSLTLSECQKYLHLEQCPVEP